LFKNRKRISRTERGREKNQAMRAVWGKEVVQEGLGFVRKISRQEKNQGCIQKGKRKKLGQRGGRKGTELVNKACLENTVCRELKSVRDRKKQGKEKGQHTSKGPG